MTVDDGGAGSVEGEADDALGYLAHELKGPLTAITGFSELLGDELGTSTDKARHHLEAIQRNAQSLGDIIATITDARALSRGTFKLSLERTDVSQLVHEIISDSAPLVREHVVVERIEPGVVCAVDPTRLSQAVRNLLTNAVRFSPAGSEIEARVRALGPTCEIGLRDHGPGIPEEGRHLLFRKFARLTPGRGGMGIGLYLSRAIARAHGGDAGYEPADEGGSDFWVRLPRAD